MATKSAEIKREATDAPATSTAPVADAPAAPALVPEGIRGQVTPTNVANLAVEMVGMATRLADDDLHAAASEADVTDELAKGGPAFGTFLKSVGLAVAETQAALDKTLADTARALSKETVRIPAAFVQEVNDEGEVVQVVPDENTGELPGAIMQEFPLLAFVPLTGYGVRQVHLTADMDVSEFNTANGLNIKKNHVGFDLNARASYGLFGGFSASGDTALKTTFDNDSERRTTSEDKAAGKLHMEATIEPRHDILIPKPFLIQRGPKISMVPTGRAEFAGNTATTVPEDVTRREVTVTLKLLNKDGDPIPERMLDLTCDGNLFCDTGETPETDSDGKLVFKVVRDGMTKDNNAPTATVVRARMKLVAAEVVINI